MTDIQLAAEELTLAEIQSAADDAQALLEKLQRLPAGRHTSISVAGIENVIFRLREERRIVAGRVMAANQADPSNFP